MNALQIITSARDVLQDAGATYWPDAELLRWLNEARLEAYRLRPDLFNVTEAFECEPGTQQTLPGGARGPMTVNRNISAPSQRQVTPTQEIVLAAHRPNWRGQAGAAEILHYLYDAATPGEFDIYPPAREEPPVVVEITYPALPTIVQQSDLTTEMAQEGEFAPALIDYVLYRAFLKEADTVPNFSQRAGLHLTECRNKLLGAAPSQAAS